MCPLVNYRSEALTVFTFSCCFYSEMQIGKCLGLLLSPCCLQVAMGGMCALVQCLIIKSLWGYVCVCMCVRRREWERQQGPHVASNEPQWWISSESAYWSLACCPHSNFQQGSASSNKSPVSLPCVCVPVCVCVWVCDTTLVFRVCSDVKSQGLICVWCVWCVY